MFDWYRKVARQVPIRHESPPGDGLAAAGCREAAAGCREAAVCPAAAARPAVPFEASRAGPPPGRVSASATAPAAAAASSAARPATSRRLACRPPGAAARETEGDPSAGEAGVVTV